MSVTSHIQVFTREGSLNDIMRARDQATELEGFSRNKTPLKNPLVNPTLKPSTAIKVNRT